MSEAKENAALRAEVVDVMTPFTDDDTPTLERFFQLQLCGNTPTRAYEMAFGNAQGLSEATMRKRAAGVVASPEYQKIRMDIAALSGKRINGIALRLIELLEHTVVAPIETRHAAVKKQVGEMTDEEKDILLTSTLADIKNTTAFGKKGDLQYAVDLLRSLRDSLGLSDHKRQITVNVAHITDGRRRQEVALPTDGGAWRYDAESETLIHHPSFLKGQERAREEMGADGVRCPGDIVFGGDGTQCYAEKYKRGEGDGNQA